MKQRPQSDPAVRPYQPGQRPSLIARQRYAQLQHAARLRRAGRTIPEIVQLVGASNPTLWRLRKRFLAHGMAGLELRTWNCGGKSDLIRLRVPRWVLRAVERLALERGCTIPAAWRRFSRTPKCPPALAARLRRSIPPSFIEATRLRTLPVRVGKHTTAPEQLSAALKTQLKAKKS